MTMRRLAIALIAGTGLLVAGCASSASNTQAGGAHVRAADAAMTPGMVMADGTTMGAAAPAAGPSAAARMICSSEARGDIATVSGTKDVPAPSAKWANHVYTCTYRLPIGRLVLSVTESATPAEARRFAEGLRGRLGQTTKLNGLTDLAFATPTGIVALVKDNDTLRIDASQLPARFGAQGEKRGDFAYELASDILGCWTGD